MAVVPESRGGVPGRPGADPGEPPTLLYLVKQVELASRMRLDEMFRDESVTTLQYTALSVLARTGGLTAAQLARRSFVTDQSMADMVRLLRSAGYVERHRDPADRRRMVLQLTADGRDLMDRYVARIRVLEAAMLVGLTGDEIAALRAAVALCRANLLQRGTEPSG